jgi:tetratricopeptide (TPR) repeat protein
MIHLTYELVPSTLFCHQDPSDLIRYLDTTVCNCQEIGDPDGAEECAKKVEAACKEARLYVEQAAALMLLSDIERQRGRLEPALSYARKAHEILQRQAGQNQRHNEAAASYGLGLLHHLRHDYLEAIKWYQNATELFQTAKRYWATKRSQQQVRICVWVSKWIDALRNDAIQRKGFEGFQTVFLVPAAFQPHAQNGSPLRVGRLGLDQDRLSDRLIIGDQEFCLPVDPVTHQRREVTIHQREAYCILQVPAQAYGHVKAQKGDCLLAERIDQDPTGREYYVVEKGDKVVFAKFQRDLSTGTVSLEDVVTGEDLGVGNEALYRPITLLKPLGKGP